jgi:hypothetical protein
VFRGFHTAVTIGFLGAIGYVWWCALRRRRGPALYAAVGALAGEGLLVAANGGDCPLGPLQARLGDPVPLFELVLPRHAARLAVPVLGLVAGAGAVLALRSPEAAAEAHRPAGGAPPALRL